MPTLKNFHAVMESSDFGRGMSVNAPRGIIPERAAN